MSLSRRDLSLLLPALVATGAAAQEKSNAGLPSKIYHNDKIPYEGDEKKKGREFLHMPTHGGFMIASHETILGAGVVTHAPHRHEHEELLFVVEGTAETSIDGKKELAEAGSVICFGSNSLHNLRNAGTKPCRYYVVELRGKEA